MADHDVIGAVEVLGHILRSEELAGLAEPYRIEFLGFDVLRLPIDAPDRVVWATCQSAGVVLITGNRSGGPESLDDAIRELSTPESLPTLTLADPRRVMLDRDHADAVALGLLDILDRIDELRGTGRLFLP